MAPDLTEAGQRSTLGANKAAYSFVGNHGINADEWDWCCRKREAIVSILSNVCRLAPGAKLADVGCRNGADAEFYGAAVRASEIHGFEIGPAPLAAAEQRHVIGHVWISGESPCPVGGDTFDAVVAGDVIEHLFDTDVFLDELHRVLKPRGWLIVTTPNLAWWWSRLRLLVGRLPSGIGGASPRYAAGRGVDVKHLRVSTAPEWTYVFQRHAFDLCKLKGFNYPRHLRFPAWVMDDVMTNRASFAHSLLFVLRKRAQ